MKPRPSSKSLSPKTIHLGLLALCVISSAISVHAAKTGKVVIRENVTASKRNELANRLRSISGLANLGFDSDGVLILGEGSNGGSQGARALLDQAVNGDKVIIIEDATARSDVAFCRVVPGRWLSDNDTRLPAFVVLIDFTDFRQILGDEKARAAFDVGWGFLHELDHVVTDSIDSDEQGSLGECENHINAMRRELGLPLRADYFFTESSLKTDPNFGTKLVRLPFELYNPRTTRRQRYWLIWDAASVGGLVAKHQTAAVRSAPDRRN